MKTALVITHTSAESAGTLATWLPAAGVALDVCEPWKGDALPDELASHDALIVMGGPQQAYDDRSASWLAATKELLRSAVARKLPVLGICLGAQLLAEATGGRVGPGDDGPELGARLVSKRDVAADDPVFAEIPLSPVVVQWHWDVVAELPPGAVLLAASPRYPNQAFRVGDCAYGLQFHIETPAEMVQSWASADADQVRAAGFDPDVVAARAVAVLSEVEEVWRPFVERFAALIRGETRTFLPVV